MLGVFLQVEGLNYIEIFASISIPFTWRILLAIANAQNWEIKQIDVIGAFLNSDLTDVNIYLQVPNSFNEWTNFVTLLPVKV